MTLMSERPVQQAASPGDVATHLEPLVRAVLGRRLAGPLRAVGRIVVRRRPAGSDHGQLDDGAAPAAVGARRARAGPGLRGRRPRHRRRHLRRARRARRRARRGRPRPHRPRRCPPRLARGPPARRSSARPPPPPPEEHPRVAAGATPSGATPTAIAPPLRRRQRLLPASCSGRAMTYSCARFVDADADAGRRPRRPSTS